MITKDEKAIIWLSLFSFLSYKKQTDLLSLFSSPQELWDNFSENNSDILAIVGNNDIAKMMFSKNDSFIENYVNSCKEQGIHIVTLYSKNYSKLLKEIDTPPMVLYCKGNINLLNTKSVAIVGTRRPTKYGKDVTKQFAEALALSGITIVSGLADGIDAVAHEGALSVKGNTIAVLGCGVNEIYPLSNAKLFREIEKSGLIISEYKPTEKPQTFYFPARNRIVAGLSSGVLITEATEKSGTMHTKNYALDFNRNLFVVPGRINDKYSKGCNQIIQNLQASMVIEPADILKTYNLDENVADKKVVQLDFNDEIVYNIITDSSDEVHYEEILKRSSLDTKTLNTVLIRLEIKGLITKLAGNYFYKSGI